jgi:parallel beta-helix repeat protein
MIFYWIFYRYNTLSNCSVNGSSLLQTTAIGVSIYGGGNDHNVLQALTIGGAYYAIRLEGNSSLSDSGNLVEGCTINTSRTAIRSDWQAGAQIHNNTVHTGFAGATGICYGIYLSSTASGKSVTASANTLCGGQGTATLYGVYCSSGAGIANVWNNFLYDWAPSGTSGFYGISVAGGLANIQFNSLYLNDVSSSGEVVGIGISGAGTVANVSNNVIENAEPQNSVICIAWTSGTLVTNYNAFYNGVSNANFLVGRIGLTSNYPTLAEWQNATGQETNSLYGDPEFRNSLDLHILPSASLLSNAGMATPGVTTDFDGDLRQVTPDIGADEYTYGVVSNDYSVEWLTTPDSIYLALTAFEFPVVVRNLGTQNQTNIPVRLLFAEQQVDEELVSLMAGSMDTVALSWTTPDTGIAYGGLKARTSLTLDEVTANDSVLVDVIVVGQPLSGVYYIGGDTPDFVSFAESALALRLRGVAGSALLQVQFGIYNEAVVIGSIPGTSASNRVTYRALGLGENRVTLTNSTATATLTLTAARFLAFEEIDVAATGNCATAVLLKGGSDFNEFRDCVIRCSDSVLASTVAARIELDGNDSNVLDRVTLRGAYTGIALSGGTPSANLCTGNTVRNCLILNARYGVYIENQSDCIITDNDIQPGSPTTLVAACYGVCIGNLGQGGSVRVCGNEIHHFSDQSTSTTNRAVGVYCGAASGGTAHVCNNFIYDFAGVQSLKVNAIYLSSGNNQVFHNSITIGDLTTTAEISGVHISTGSSHTVLNNIIVSLEDDMVSYGIYQSGGSGLVSNYNDLYGSSPAFVTGRILTTNYPTLASWQNAGFDQQGLAVDPLFMNSTDLHIRLAANTVNGLGTLSDSVLTDFDGDSRLNPPDIGADEYSYNTAPDTVRNLTILFTENSVTITWHSVPGATEYHVYTNTIPIFDPTPENLLATTSQTNYADTQYFSFSRRFYMVTASATIGLRAIRQTGAGR